MRRAARLPGPLAAAVALCAVLAATGDDADTVTVCRHAEADGRVSVKIDLDALDRKYRTLAKETGKAFTKNELKLPDLQEQPVSAGLPRARARDERTVELAQAVPAAYRALTLYFVTVPGGGRRPAVLSRELPEHCEVFVVEAESLDDVAKLSNLLKRRVSVATAEFARALGVRARDARVTLSKDGKRATIIEEGP